MVDTNKIAIADVLKHPEYGLVSHQPILSSPIEDEIRVSDMKGTIHFVLASECVEPTYEESQEYWDAT